jgi:hypothetical protein
MGHEANGYPGPDLGINFFQKYGIARPALREREKKNTRDLALIPLGWSPHSCSQPREHGKVQLWLWEPAFGLLPPAIA